MEEEAVSVSKPFPGSVAIPGWKRILDLLCIFVAVPVLAPVMLVIALAIKIISPGPILFQQDRIGYLGRRFRCFKFRTMRVNAAAHSHQSYLKDLMQSEAPMTKMDLMGDTRLFPLSSALRATGLDELPQILNVLRGEMSLVGPRPCLPYEYESYSAAQKRRFNTVPGITGLWQVSGKNNTTFKEMIDLDLEYLSNRSLWLDIKIMLRTFPVLLVQLKELVKNRLKRLRRGKSRG